MTQLVHADPRDCRFQFVQFVAMARSCLDSRGDIETTLRFGRAVRANLLGSFNVRLAGFCDIAVFGPLHGAIGATAAADGDGPAVDAAGVAPRRSFLRQWRNGATSGVFGRGRRAQLGNAHNVESVGLREDGGNP